jgi:type I restriction-modification system DNA methylase subunit
VKAHSEKTLLQLVYATPHRFLRKSRISEEEIRFIKLKYEKIPNTYSIYQESLRQLSNWLEDFDVRVMHIKWNEMKSLVRVIHKFQLKWYLTKSTRFVSNISKFEIVYLQSDFQELNVIDEYTKHSDILRERGDAISKRILKILSYPLNMTIEDVVPVTEKLTYQKNTETKNETNSFFTPQAIITLL